MRLGERLKIRWDIENLPQDALIPTLSIQPLVENAIYHGIEPLMQGGTISISGEMSKDLIHIHIRNPIPADNNYPRHEGNKIALDNITNRLAAVYQNRGKVAMKQHERHFEVTLSIPYQRELP